MRSELYELSSDLRVHVVACPAPNSKYGKKQTNKQNKSETDGDTVEQWDRPLTTESDRPSPWRGVLT